MTTVMSQNHRSTKLKLKLVVKSRGGGGLTIALIMFWPKTFCTINSKKKIPSKKERKVSLVDVFRRGQFHNLQYLSRSARSSRALSKRKPAKFMQQAMVNYELSRPLNMCCSHQSRKTFGRGQKTERKEIEGRWQWSWHGIFHCQRTVALSRFKGLLALQKKLSLQMQRNDIVLPTRVSLL